IAQSFRERLRKHIAAAFDLLPARRISTKLFTVIPRHRIGETIDRHFLSTPAIKSQGIQPAWIKRLERQRKLLHILVREIVIFRNARRALFGKQSVRKRLAQRMHAPARTRPRFEYSHVVTKLREFVS